MFDKSWSVLASVSGCWFGPVRAVNASQVRAARPLICRNRPWNELCCGSGCAVRSVANPDDDELVERLSANDGKKHEPCGVE